MTFLPQLLWPSVCRCTCYPWAHHAHLGRCRRRVVERLSWEGLDLSFLAGEEPFNQRAEDEHTYYLALGAVGRRAKGW